MFVKDIMTTRVVTVEMDDSIRDVNVIFQKTHFHHLLVIDQKKELVGVVSDRDMLKNISPFLGKASERSQDKRTLDRRVHQIMSHHPITVQADAREWDAARIILERGVSCLPVVDDHNHVVGIVTWKDLMKHFINIKMRMGDSGQDGEV